MFSKPLSGASITIAPDDVGPERACIVIGWVSDKSVALSTRDRIAREFGLELRIKSESEATADLEGWRYTFLAFTKPQVTDQTRVLFVIAPANDDPDPKGN